MANQIAKDIARTALSLQAERPDVSALEILDVAMLGRADSEPVFDQADGDQVTISLVHPSSDFGRLLASALLLPGQAVDVRRWADEVLTPFAQRYNLWARRANLAASTWQTRCFEALRDEDPSLQFGGNDDVEPAPNQMDEHEVLETLAMAAIELYDSPASDGLTPEVAVARWRAAMSSAQADFQAP